MAPLLLALITTNGDLGQAYVTRSAAANAQTQASSVVSYSMKSDPAPYGAGSVRDGSDTLPAGALIVESSQAGRDRAPRGSAEARADQVWPTERVSTTLDTVPGSDGTTVESDNSDGSQDFTVSAGYQYPDLGQYLHGLISFSIWLPFRGAVDGDGHPVSGNSYYGKKVDLTIHAYDVDELCGAAAPCEVDRVVVNGTEIQGKLHGADITWSDTTFSIDASLLRFQSSWAGPGDGENPIEIHVDVLGTGGWYVEVDSAAITLPSREASRPIVLFHGLSSSSTTWTERPGGVASFVEDVQAAAASMGMAAPQILMPDYDGSVGVDDGLSFVTPRIENFLNAAKEQAGWTQVNLVGHSLGGLTARAYAATHPMSVKRVVLMGTPNHGIDAAKFVCVGPQAWFKLAPCVAAVYDVQPGEVERLNAKYPDSDLVAYVSLAGWDDGHGCPLGIKIYGADEYNPSDGCVTVESTQWLVRGLGSNKGTEEGGSYYYWFVDHDGLVHKVGDWRRQVECLLLSPGKDCTAISEGQSALARRTSSSSLATDSSLAMDASTVLDDTIPS
jgi:pimeloyl-ACP methyl ester carboxylesterase